MKSFQTKTIKRCRFALFQILFLLFFCIASVQAEQSAANTPQSPAAEKQSESLRFITPTWIDFAFINHYPVPKTRFADFSDANFGGEIRINFMLFNIRPLWLSAALMSDWNKTNSVRLDRILDIGAAAGAGWRFTILKKFFITPRVSYGFMLHAVYGDYYGDADIYPGDSRAGSKKVYYFSDQYFQYELECAYDISSFVNRPCEIFLSPSFIHFAEKRRQGLEFGYLLGVRAKLGSSGQTQQNPALLAGKIVDAEIKSILPNAVPVITGGNAGTAPLSSGETFAYSVSPDTEYTINVSCDGYEPAAQKISAGSLISGKRTTVIIEMKLSHEWGLIGTVIDKDTREPIKGVAVIITDSRKKQTEFKTGRNGDFRLKAEPNTDYNIMLKKKGYFTVRADFSTKDKKPGWYDVMGFMTTEFQKAVVGATIEFGNIYYDSGSWTIRPDGIPGLDKMAQFLTDNSQIVVELGAHTDSMGDATSNQVLSQKRAQSAVEYLIKKGIASSRITSKGYGETKLKNRCADGVPCSAEEHQVNRRTELIVQEILPE